MDLFSSPITTKMGNKKDTNLGERIFQYSIENRKEVHPDLSLSLTIPPRLLGKEVVENGLVGEIKYLSPHFARCNIFTSPPQKKDTEGKQKFMRKQGNNQETMRERNINKNQP